MYVIIEGIDTAGKSTQLNILQSTYPDALFIKEPGETNLGKTIREIVLNGKATSKMAEMFLFLADRAQTNYAIINKYNHKMIISDRGFISGIGYATHISISEAIRLNMLALEYKKPDKIIMLELSQDELIKRLSLKNHDAIENRGIDYLLKVQDRMKQAIKQLNLDYIIIDAKNDKNKIAKTIQEFINK